MSPSLSPSLSQSLFLIIGGYKSFCDTLIPLFWTSSESSLSFKARVGSIICASWGHIMCYTFPEIRLRSDTCQPLDGQHGSQANLSQVPASRHWWGSKPRTLSPSPFLSPSLPLSPSLSKFIIMPMVTDHLMGKILSLRILSVKWSIWWSQR